MSGAVAYLQHSRRGLPSRIRLLGAGPEQSFDSFSEQDDPIAVGESISRAAAWLAERTGGEGLSILCLDLDGASCGWLSAPGTDPAVVSAALAQSDSNRWGVPDAGEASVQALADPEAGGGGIRLRRQAPTAARRLAVMIEPDVTARLLIDALDERSVGVARVVSFWHAAALAWDPASPALNLPSAGADVAAVAAPGVVAQVVVDPVGRLVWTWSRAGEVIAAGAFRLPGEGEQVAVGEPEVARLAADWLSWSVQIGAAPGRIVCLSPELGEQGGLSAPELARALSRRFPSATLDLATHDDPVGATLARLSAGTPHKAPAFARTTLTSASSRPTRAHRQMFVWAAALFAAIGVVLFVIALDAMSAAGDARRQLEESRTKTRELARAALPQNATAIQQAQAASNPRTFLEAEIARREKLVQTTDTDPVKPILQELETLSLVIGTPGLIVENVNIASTSLRVELKAPDLRTAEMIEQSIRSLGTSAADWRPARITPHASEPGAMRVALEGSWKPQRTGGRP